MPRRKKKPVTPPFRPCGHCATGFRVEIRQGERFAIRCSCWNRWKRGPWTAATDVKAKAAGE